MLLFYLPIIMFQAMFDTNNFDTNNKAKREVDGE